MLLHAAYTAIGKPESNETLSERWLLGIDGGGTKTAAWLGTVSEKRKRETATGAELEHDATQLKIVSRGTSGPSNPRAIGFERAFENIDNAIENAFAAAALPREIASAACFCLAGVARPADVERVQSWIADRKLAKQFRLAMDVEAILAAAYASPTPNHVSNPIGDLGNDDDQSAGTVTGGIDIDSALAGGIALIAGTGSIAWGQTSTGQTARSGGWGYLLGDEGSAYAISIGGLQAACLAADGRGSSTQLLPAFLSELDCPKPADLVAIVYDSETTRDKIAGWSQVVFQCARAGDATARCIIDQAADDLAIMVASVADQLALPSNGFRLAFAGGVACHQPAFVQRIRRQLNVLHRTPQSCTLVEAPVLGALHLAHRLLS